MNNKRNHFADVGKMIKAEKATIYDYARMCVAEDCSFCPLSPSNNGTNFTCNMCIVTYPDKANEIILKWSKEHPIKTRQGEFLKMFPNAKIDNCGTSILCPQWVDKDFKCNLQTLCCDECCIEYWLAEVDENE